MKKKAPASDPDGTVEIGLSGLSKKKEANNRRKSNGKAETIPIKPSALKSYAAAEENNMKNKESQQCNVNLGYDASGDTDGVAAPGVDGQNCGKHENVPCSETQNGGKGSEKHTKECEERGGV